MKHRPSVYQPRALLLLAGCVLPCYTCRVSNTQNAQGGARVRIPPPLIFLGFIVLGVWLHHRRPLVVAIPPIVRHVAAGLVGAAGAALVATSFNWFRRTGQNAAPWKPSPTLILQGPYKFSRNPMYLGMALVVLAPGVWMSDLWLAIFAAASLIVVRFTAVLPEETYLTERFGESYTQYLAKVRRWL